MRQNMLVCILKAEDSRRLSGSGCMVRLAFPTTQYTRCEISAVCWSSSHNDEHLATSCVNMLHGPEKYTRTCSLCCMNCIFQEVSLDDTLWSKTILLTIRCQRAKQRSQLARQRLVICAVILLRTAKTCYYARAAVTPTFIVTVLERPKVTTLNL